MNLAQVLHQRWAAAAGLEGLLPASRVFTGLSVAAGPPFAVFSRLAGRPAARFNDGAAVDAIGLRIEVFDADYEHASAVVHQVKLAFDRTSFALAGSDKVLDMRRTDEGQTQQPDGMWRMTIDFECHVLVESG